MVPNIFGLELDHAVDLIRFVRADIMQSGRKAQITQLGRGKGWLIAQQTKDDIGDPHAVIHQPLIYMVAGAAQDADDGLIVDKTGVVG